MWNMSCREEELEEYLAEFNGLARFLRIIHILKNCSDYSAFAGRYGMEYARKLYWPEVYLGFINQSNNMTIARGETERLEADSIWLTSTRVLLRRKEGIFTRGLARSQLEGNPEYIRCFLSLLSDHEERKFNFAHAEKWILLQQYYVSTPEEILMLYSKLTKINVMMQRWSKVLRYVRRAHLDLLSFPRPLTVENKKKRFLLRTEFSCCAGIAEMRLGHYRIAANHFLNANYEHVSIPDLISGTETAYYTVLCALIGLSREEIKIRILKSRHFASFLNSEAKLKEMLNDFISFRFQEFFKHLEDIKHKALLDIYLGSNTLKMYEAIKYRVMVLYFRPYIKLKLVKMERQFLRSSTELVRDLRKLIARREIMAEIDTTRRELVEVSNVRAAFDIWEEKRQKADLSREYEDMFDPEQAEPGFGPYRKDNIRCSSSLAFSVSGFGSCEDLLIQRRHSI